jgi:hypothetical protein
MFRLRRQHDWIVRHATGEAPIISHGSDSFSARGKKA